MCVLFLGLKDPLEEDMAAHCSILAWKIPWKEETVGYSPWSHKQLDATEHLSISQYKLKIKKKKKPIYQGFSLACVYP